MSSILIQNGRVIDPSQNVDRTTSVFIRDGKIVGLDVSLESLKAGEYGPSANGELQVIDAAGKIVTPGLIDMHVHLREPGREEDETIATGTAAALAGGFTSIACMPNLEPPTDTAAAVEFIKRQAERADNCNVYVIATVSQKREGKQLAELGQLVKAGAVGFTDDGAPVYDPELMRRALEYAQMFDKPILNHEEVLELTRGGVMHEGAVSMLLGLQGMPGAAEDVMVARDVVLSEATGGHVHVMHISSHGSVDIVRRAKARGAHVTTEVCPHHFVLTDECLRSFDSNFKMSPPLRAQQDVDACIKGLADDTIDCIVTDHAPHQREKKLQELDLAPFGIVGLETCLPLTITKLIEPGILTWPQAIAKLTINPAKILRLDRGTLVAGAVADVTIIDPGYEWTVDVEQFKSLSKNSPFQGWRLKGRADAVIVGGKVKYRAGE